MCWSTSPIIYDHMDTFIDIDPMKAGTQTLQITVGEQHRGTEKDPEKE